MLENFLDRFGDGVSQNMGLPVGNQLNDSIVNLQQPGALDKFITKFNGNTESYFFYDGTVELRYAPDPEHKYYKVGPLGELTPLDGVTDAVHIIDKSPALVPWSAKMVVEKLLRIMPVYIDENGCTMVEQMSLEELSKIALDAKTAPRDNIEEASDIGRMAHAWLERYIKAVLNNQSTETILSDMPKDERARNCCYAALGWMKDHNVRWICTEQKVFSLKYGYAGTMDGKGLVDSCHDPICCPIPFKDRLSLIDWKSSNYLYIEYLYQTAAYEQADEEEHGIDIQDRWINRLGKYDGEFDPWHTTAADFQEDFEGFLDALSLYRSVGLTEERMKGQKKRIRDAKKAQRNVIKELKKAEERQQKAEAKEKKKAATVAARVVKKELEKAEKAAAKALAKKEKTELKVADKLAVQIKEEIIPCEGCKYDGNDYAHAFHTRVVITNTTPIPIVDLPTEILVSIPIELPKEKV